MDIKESLSEFQFIGSSIRSISLKNDLIQINDAMENLNRFIDVDYSIDELNVMEDEVYGIITLNVKVKVSEKKRKMSINLCVQGCFTSNRTTSDEEFIEMLSNNGCATLYSISRAMIINLSSQSLASGSIVLPMINVFKLNENKQKKSKQE